MVDLLTIYNTLPNKLFLWSIMRYICLAFKIYYNISIEIHSPRDSTEVYTYHSDKMWAKILYGLLPEKLYRPMLQKIYEGSQNNLKQYWYSILLQNNLLLRDSIKNEVSYYLYKNDLVDSDKKEKEDHEKILNYNKTIANILNYVIKIKSITKETALHLLRYICIHDKLDDSIVNKFYIYLISLPTNPCLESENREDMLCFLDNFLYLR